MLDAAETLSAQVGSLPFPRAKLVCATRDIGTRGVSH
jgi:hypothetical protein